MNYKLTSNVWKAIRTWYGNNKPDEKYLLKYCFCDSLVVTLAENLATENSNIKPLTSVVFF